MPRLMTLGMDSEDRYLLELRRKAVKCTCLLIRHKCTSAEIHLIYYGRFHVKRD